MCAGGPARCRRRESAKMEAVAIHVDPKPCRVAREGDGEASVGESVGQPLSRESDLARDADAVSLAEGHTGGCAIASTRPISRGLRPWHAQTLRVTGTGRSPVRPLAIQRGGPHREVEEPEPMMHRPEKSDPSIVAGKPTNNAEGTGAESAERREGAKGNTLKHGTRRTEPRRCVSGT